MDNNRRSGFQLNNAFSSTGAHDIEQLKKSRTGEIPASSGNTGRTGKLLRDESGQMGPASTPSEDTGKTIRITKDEKAHTGNTAPVPADNDAAKTVRISKDGNLRTGKPKTASADGKKASGKPAESRGKAAAGQPADSRKAGEQPAESRGKAAARKRREAGRKTKYIVIASAITVLVITAAFVLGHMEDRRSFQTYYNDARQYYYAGDYDKALSSLRFAMKYDDDSYDCKLLMVDCYVAGGNYEKALEILRTMDLNDNVVAERIKNIEDENRYLLAEEKVTVAGEHFSAADTSIELDGLGLSGSLPGELAELYYLTGLSVQNNSLNDISLLSGLGGLVTLKLSGNNITDISPLAGLSELRYLYLDANPVTDFSPLYGLKGLSVLSIKNVDISRDALSELVLMLPECAIYTDSDSGNSNEISFGGLTFSTDVNTINLSGIGINDISALSSCRQLTSADVSNNDIADISPLMDIPGLTWLNISGNDITDIRPLMGIHGITYLNAEYNSITSLSALGNLSGLSELYLGGNAIRDFSALAKLDSLTILGLENTGITDADLSCLAGLSSLKILMLDDNPGLTGNEVDRLRDSLPGCKIYTSSDIVYMVDLDGFMFRSDITDLQAANLGITDIINIRDFNHLDVINLCNNSISDVSILQWMSGVKELNLSGNGLTDITAVAYMPTLEKLDVSNNNLTSINALVNLTGLKELHIGGNQLTETLIAELRNYLPDCDIYSD